MPSKSDSSRAGIGRPSAAINGIVPGSTDHQILLALRAPGGMTSDQLYARFNGSTSPSLHRLKAAQLIDVPSTGKKGKQVNLTETGRNLVSPDGPLARSKTLITYCRL